MTKNNEQTSRLSTKQINYIIKNSKADDERLQAFEDQEAKRKQPTLRKIEHGIKKSAAVRVANNAVDYIGNKANRAGNYINDKANRAGNYINDKANRAGNYINDKANRAGNYINDKVEDFNLAIDKKIVEHGAKRHAHKMEQAGKKYRIDKLLGREDKASKHYNQGKEELTKTTNYANAYRNIDARQHQKAEHRKAEYEQKLLGATKDNLFKIIANKFKRNKKVDQNSVNDRTIVARNQNKDISRYQ